MAKQFKFRLQRVLKLRDRVRDRRRQLLADALRFRDRLDEQRFQLTQSIDQEKQALKNWLGQPSLDVDRLVQARTYSGVLERHLFLLDRQREQAEQVVSMRRQELMLAERDVRILEKLEETFRGRYDRQAAKEEIAQLDELANSSAIRQSLQELRSTASPDNTV